MLRVMADRRIIWQNSHEPEVLLRFIESAPIVNYNWNWDQASFSKTFWEPEATRQAALIVF